jgi:hypothetical protein
MIRVNIPVTAPDMNWIVGRLAKELVARLPKYGFDAQINRSEPAGVEYHSNVYGPPKGTGRVNIGMFAHDDGRPHQFATKFDGHVLLNPEMQEYLRSLGAERPVVIEQAVDEAFMHRPAPIFGVAGSVKPGNPRKGEALVQRMVDHGYKVMAWGKGWPCHIFSSDYQNLPQFYEMIDYYVCTSTLEGGCTPIIECMAMKIPVIAPRIGFAIVRPVLEYEAGSWESLNGVLHYLTHHRTYDDWARDHATYFREVLDAAVK